MAISTANLSDLYSGDLKYLDSVFKSYGKKSKFSGSIVTIRCFEDFCSIQDMISQSGKNRVLLIDGGASENSSLFDEKLALLAIKNNWEGVIINGTIRNSRKIHDLAIGVKALGESVRRSPCSPGNGETNIDIEMAGTLISPGDIVIVDEDGIVVFEKNKTNFKIKPKF